MIKIEKIDQPELKDSNSFSPGFGGWFFFSGSVFFFMANLFAAIAVYPAYSLEIGSTPFQAGLQNTVFAISAVLLRFIFAPQMDKQGPKPLMLLGLFTFATTPLILIVFPSFGVLLAARAYQALGLAIVLPGISALIAAMAPGGRIGVYLGGTRIFFNLALLAGPSSALYIITHHGYETWFVISTLTGIMSLLMLAFLKVPTVKVNSEKITGTWNQISLVLSNRLLYPIIGGIALLAIMYSAVVSFAAVYLESIAPEADAAFFFVVLGLAGIAASMTAGLLSDRFGRQRVSWPLLVLLGTGAILFYLLSITPVPVFVCALIFGISTQGSSLVFTAWLIDLSRPELRATTIAIQENTIDICFAVGALSFGLAAQGPGLGSAFLITGLLTILAALLLGRKNIEQE